MAAGAGEGLGRSSFHPESCQHSCCFSLITLAGWKPDPGIDGDNLLDTGGNGFSYSAPAHSPNAHRFLPWLLSLEVKAVVRRVKGLAWGLVGGLCRGRAFSIVFICCHPALNGKQLRLHYSGAPAFAGNVDSTEPASVARCEHQVTASQ